MSYTPANLNDCHSISDPHRLGRRLPGPVFHYLDGAAETEFTARRNTAAFDATSLLTRCLVDVSIVTTATRVFGQDVRGPVICSPSGGPTA